MKPWYYYYWPVLVFIVAWTFIAWTMRCHGEWAGNLCQ